MVAICLIMVYHHIEPKSVFVSFLLYDGEIRTQLGLLFFLHRNVQILFCS